MAQKKTVFIQWENKKNLAIASSTINIDGASSFFVDESNFTETLASSWRKSNNSYAGVRASNIVFEDITTTLEGIEKSFLPRMFNIKVESKKARDKFLEILSFSPLINQNGRIKRLISFDLESRKTIGRSGKSLNVPGRSSSVLANGVWKRFSIDTTGVYKITPQFLSSIGVNLNGVNSNTIKIYGTGGKALRLQNDQNRFYDVPEVPTKLVDQDGVFSGDDYFLFYGQGTQGFDQENDTNLNPYSDEVYYYVTTGGQQKKSISVLSEPVGSSSVTYNSYDFETFYERDLTNIGGIGRKWFGDEFGAVNERNYNFEIPNPVLNSKADIRFIFGAVYQSPPSLTVFASGSAENKTQEYTFSPQLNLSNVAYRTASPGSSLELNASSTINLRFVFNQNVDPSSSGFIDYIRVGADSQLRGVNKQFSFSKIDQQNQAGIVEFIVSNAQNISSIWDVTDQYAITEKSNNGSPTLSLKTLGGQLNKYVVVDQSDLLSPKRVGASEVANQDLKGNIFRNGNLSNAQGDVEYLIITRADFLGVANQLANFRRQRNNYNVKVVTVDQIYNEFSTGQQDISAIRNFVKYVYDNALDSSKRLKYLCFVGDGSYDYKDRIKDNTNIVPLFYSANSVSFATSFASDDFYGMMDDNEGVSVANDLLDIAVGRMVAPTPEIANDVVEKNIRYHSQESFGTWRNNFLLIADDVDPTRSGRSRPIDPQLELKLDFVAEQMKAKLPNANIDKLYCDAFKAELGPAGQRYPVVRDRFLNAFEIGTSYMNYFGHGGEDGLSGEFIFRADDAKALTNRDRLTVFTTLTCELTRFDNPLRQTAGEFMYWNKNGGAVALLTTIRNLFVGTGLQLNPSLADALFTNNQESVPIGEALRVAKNELVGFRANKRTVFCIGDPALKIAFPKPKVILTEINDVSVFSNEVESVKALSKVKLKGRVVASNEKILKITKSGGEAGDYIVPNPIENYNGEIGVVLYDKTEDRKTLGNDGTKACYDIDDEGRITSCADEELYILDFKNIGNQVFRGLASVKNGEFDIEFVLSKNIKLPIGDGKVSFYAKEQKKLEDNSGFSLVKIGGLNTEAELDEVPPTVELFLDTENFISGQLVSNTPTLIAKFSDSNGINTAGGVGHDIVAIIDGNEKNPITLNEFYSTEIDDFTKGVVNFRLRDLSPGEHTLKIRASDVFNNVAFQEINFIVGEKDQFTVFDVLNYPNPFTSYTEFWFNHSGPREDVLEVMIQVLTVTGKVVTSKFATLSGNTNTYRGDITWDGRDDFGKKVGKGVYLYKIIVKSALTKKTFSKIEKLVVL